MPEIINYESGPVRPSIAQVTQFDCPPLRPADPISHSHSEAVVPPDGSACDLRPRRTTVEVLHAAAQGGWQTTLRFALLISTPGIVTLTGGLIWRLIGLV